MSTPYPPPPHAVAASSDVSDLARPLAEGAGWIKFLAIVQIVFSVIYVIASLGIGLVIAWLPIWLSVLLLQSAGALRDAQARGDGQALKLALGKLKLYFMIQAIAMIVGFCLGLLAVVLGLSLGAHMFHPGGLGH